MCGPGIEPGSALQVNPADQRAAGELRPGRLGGSWEQERANAGKAGEKGGLEGGGEATLERLLKVPGEAGRAEADGTSVLPGLDSVIKTLMRGDADLGADTFVLVATESLRL